MVQFKTFLVIISSLIVLSACSSTPDSDTLPYVTDFKGIPIYGKLELVANNYTFTKFATKPINNEPWVNLATGEPSWNTAKEEDCFYKNRKNPFDCTTTNTSLFREESIDVVRTGVQTVLSFGILAAQPSKEVTFNESKFNMAVVSAGGIEQFKPAIEMYTAIQKEVRAKVGEVNSKMEKYFVNPTVDVSFTGAVDLYDDRVDIAKSVRLLKHKLDASSLGGIKSNSIDELARNAQTKKETLIAGWDELSNSANVTCEPFAREGLFSISLTCPEKIQVNLFSPIVPLKADVRFIVKDATPTNLNYSNSDGVIYTKSKNLYFSNTSDNFITIESISYYYGNKVATLSDLKISVPPNSSSELMSMSRFGISGAENRHVDVSTEDAKHKILKYGFAVQYSIADFDKKSSRTFLGVEEFTLLDIIKGRLDNK